MFDPRFDNIQPIAVASVATRSDVAHCLSFAQRFDLPITIRSGGHSYIGASTSNGFVIDLRGINSIVNNASAQAATIGAGAALVDVYSTLAGQGVSIPAGSCPSVGLSGLALGGGVGVVTRRYGLTCDRLLSVEVVTADGHVVMCDAQNEPDLYWALCGGGGSFGVVTSMTLQTHPAGELSHAYLSWPWSAAAEVLTAWQAFGPAAPHALWSSCHLLAQSLRPAPPTVSVAAVYVGDEATLNSHLDDLVGAISTPPTTRYVANDSYENTMLLEAGCGELSVEQCHVGEETPGGTLSRSAFIAGSDYFADQIPAAGVSAIVNAVATRAGDPNLREGGVSLDILGGAVDALAADATAYVHRGALFNAQYTASWNVSGNGPLARNRASLAALHGALHPHATGQAYQNYADSTLVNPQEAYYGSNLARLIQTRRTYDPTGVFTQPQGVPLS